MSPILAALLNGMLVSVPLAFVVWAVLRAMPRHVLNAATRYAVWWALLAVTVALPFSYLRVDAPASRSVAVIMPAGPVTSLHDDGDSVQIIASPDNAARASRPFSLRVAFPIRIAATPWPSRILWVWLTIAALMLVRLIVSAILLERRKRGASELRLPASGRFRVATSSDVSIPLVAGPWGRTILLPARLLNELGEREIEQIVTHEAAHLARSDDYALLIQRVVQALFILNPVVAWISARIDLEREIACDDFVVGAMGDSYGYASCLARVVELSGGVRALPMAAAAAEDRSHLATRVDMLLDNARHTGTRLLKIHIVAAATCIVALAWGAKQMPDAVAFAGPVVNVLVAAAPEKPAPVLLIPALVAQATPVLKPPPPPPPRPPTPPPPPPVPAVFDVVSIKPNPVLSGTSFQEFKMTPTPFLNGDRYVDRQTTLQYLIMKAYGVWDYQIANLPDWGQAPNGEHYAIEATLPAAKTPTTDELRSMLQALLADRFGLRLHRETKTLSVYALTAIESGTKILPVSDPKLGTTMRQLINLLSHVVDRPIVDNTGLTASYDPQAINGLHWGSIGAAHRADPLSVPEELRGALEDTLGLKLESRKEPAEVLVIDHAEKPSSN